MLSTNRQLTAEERKERKRVQNRLNQRARRQRVRDEETDTTKPFRVQRWRLGGDSSPLTRSEPHATHSSEHTANDGQALHVVCPALQSPPKGPITPSRPPTLQQGSTHCVELVLPADDSLIHLIAHNVCRGFMDNKTILRLVATFIDAFHNPPLPPHLAIACGTVVLQATFRAIPPCLFPTQLQMSSPHPSWMDALPFPEIRDNLIRRQYTFDHKSFLEDLVGDLVYHMPPGESGPEVLTPMPTPSPPTKRYSDYGLVLWGEPYLKESWEATPYFLAKWTWVVEGCHDLVHVSNKWRTTRGDVPL
ncbi:hypothetical protein EDB80DRAFT_699321 [Ilyonectria destructans]|nr:hypothetical protein EDB80DRAFT_699321 [Ilyonectria destructans]